MHGHGTFAPSMCAGDGTFRQKLCNTIPVLKAHRTRQTDKVGGHFRNPGLFRTHGNLIKKNMADQSSYCMTLVEGIYGPV